ncbi:hypothetical protein BC938DRAFT_473250 [Jimgerdemannia flammicorona]|uniref:Uncharacterized protein n=1 Tax=Jimgerdemannia flammicorona TaxID=994334 RepID=A0A433QTE7_9FUNG|nr:hypothetical protein BC938DRAFT_473250 [Jimgerdemannia flammicorona]
MTIYWCRLALLVTIAQAPAIPLVKIRRPYCVFQNAVDVVARVHDPLNLLVKNASISTDIKRAEETTGK